MPRWFEPASVIAGAVLTALAFPEAGLFPLAWVGVAPLLAAAQGTGPRRGAALGFLWGLAFFTVLIYWISIVGVLALAGLVLIQAAFVALFGAAWGWISRGSSHHGVQMVLAAALWVVIVEFARGSFPQGGFTWGQLSQSQVDVVSMMRLASLLGSWGVAAALVAVNALVAFALSREPETSRRVLGLVLAAGLLLAPLVIPPPRPGEETLRVAIVQGNVPRDMEPSVEKERLIINSHKHLTQELHDVDLVVWPESSVGIDLEQVTNVGLDVADAARGAGAPLIVGGNSELGDDRYGVMAYLISRDGEVVDRYQKTHLVPFGEYVPARDQLGWIPALRQVPRDALRGTEPTVFDVDGVPIAPVISFEGDFGPLVRDRVARGGRIVVVATNTSTWGESWASAQHLAMSRVRAAENGVPVVHAALSGSSGFISERGEVRASSRLWVPAVLIEEVPIPGGVSLYARIGDLFVAASALVVLLGAAFRLRAGRDTVRG